VQHPHWPQRLLVGAEPLFDSHRDRLIALAAHYRLPAMYQVREYTLNGGLATYGANSAERIRLGGHYVAHLQGAKPAELPAPQSTKFERTKELWL
jgi:putative ABC transport system substrate-binding protein